MIASEPVSKIDTSSPDFYVYISVSYVRKVDMSDQTNQDVFTLATRSISTYWYATFARITDTHFIIVGILILITFIQAGREWGVIFGY